MTSAGWSGHELLARVPRTHRYRLTPRGLRTAALCTKLHDRVLDPAVARSRDAPPASPPDRIWRRYEDALNDVLAKANIAA